MAGVTAERISWAIGVDSRCVDVLVLCAWTRRNESHHECTSLCSVHMVVGSWHACCSGAPRQLVPWLDVVEPCRVHSLAVSKAGESPSARVVLGPCCIACLVLRGGCIDPRTVMLDVSVACSCWFSFSWAIFAQDTHMFCHLMFTHNVHSPSVCASGVVPWLVFMKSGDTAGVFG